jgi:hypothetical protein
MTAFMAPSLCRYVKSLNRLGVMAVVVAHENCCTHESGMASVGRDSGLMLSCDHHEISGQNRIFKDEIEEKMRISKCTVLPLVAALVLQDADI